MSDIAISVQNLSKRYRIGKSKVQTTKRRLITRRIASPFYYLYSTLRQPAPDEVIWALKDVSFEVKHGEVLGVIGRNGAGKTTLLKILSRITEPTSGRAILNGRVGSLLEVGTGFHPELTGRENIYLSGAILGMKKTEIDRKFDEIVDFSGVEKFIDTPVKRYSSGMYVRLAFAVAAHLEPEILLIDEVLAVGDAEFQKKCLGKMGDVAKEGRTVLFVSHNMGAVQRLCNQTALIYQGQLAQLTSTPQVIESYLTSSTAELAEFRARSLDTAPGKGGVKLLRVSVKNSQQMLSESILLKTPFFVEIEYSLDRKIDNLRVGYRLINNDGVVVFTSEDTDPEGTGTTRQKGHYISQCTVPANLLNSGRYYITPACDQPMQEVYFLEENIVSFLVEMIGSAGATVPDGRLGVIRPSLKWKIEGTLPEDKINAK